MICIVAPKEKGCEENSRFNEVLANALGNGKVSYCIISSYDEFISFDMTDKRILFAVNIGKSGINLEYLKILKHIRLNKEIFKNSVGAIIVDGTNEMYTKSVGREFIYTANMSGCQFPGRPMVEATESLKNFNTQAKMDKIDNLTAYENACVDLMLRLKEYEVSRNDISEKPRILAIHSSNFKMSNTLLLWEMVKDNLSEFDIREIGLNKGPIADCRGCPYDACMGFSKENSCYHKDQIAKEIYPELLKCNGIVMICPNYNDAVAANITAFINRLTSPFKTHKFYDKKLFAIVVSGYSGGDIVAEQLVGAININKTFALPPYFALCETANSAREIYQCEDIVEKGRSFAENIGEAFNLNLKKKTKKSIL